jgi:hypothetical protein
MALVTGKVQGHTPLTTTVDFRSNISPYTLLYTTSTDASGVWSKYLPSGTYRLGAWGNRTSPLTLIVLPTPQTGIVLNYTAVAEPLRAECAAGDGEADEDVWKQHEPAPAPASCREIAIYQHVPGVEIDRQDIHKALKEPHLIWSDCGAEDTYHGDLPVEDALELWIVLYLSGAAAAPTLRGFNRIAY